MLSKTRKRPILRDQKDLKMPSQTTSLNYLKAVSVSTTYNCIISFKDKSDKTCRSKKDVKASQHECYYVAVDSIKNQSDKISQTLQQSFQSWKCNIQWESEYDHMKSGLFKGQISDGPVFKQSCFSYGCSFSTNHSKTKPFEIRTFLSGIQMVFDRMGAICKDFKWLGFRISDPIRKPDHLQPSLFLTIFEIQTSLVDQCESEY